MNNYIYLLLTSLVASCTLARALPQDSSRSTKPVICGTGEGKIDYGENQGIVNELDMWIKEGFAVNSGFDLTHADRQNHFPVYYGMYSRGNFTVSLVSILYHYYVPLAGIKTAISGVWSVCMNGGDQTDTDNIQFIDVGRYYTWGNCKDEELVVGIWDLGAAALVLCAWNPAVGYCPDDAIDCETRPGTGM